MKHNFFENSFILSTILEWHKLGIIIYSSKSISIFKRSLLKFSPFSSNDPRSLNCMTRLRLELSHLRDHKFKLFSGHAKIFFEVLYAKLSHDLLHCPVYRNKWVNFLEKTDSIFLQMLPYFDS